MKYFIFQGNDHDCGFTSLKMLMAHERKDKSYLYMTKILKKDKFTVTDIVKEAGRHGMLLSSYSCDDSYYEQLKVPSLTLIRNNHVVVVKKITPKKITYYDPEFGKVTVKKDEFIAIWCRIVIEIESTECMIEMTKIRRSILPLRLRILEAVAAVISTGILVGTFYLLNNEKNAVFSLLFLFLFLTAQIIENIIIYKEISFFDNKYIEPYFSRRMNCNKLSYLEFVGFKQNYFTKSRGLLSSALVAFMITFLLCFNDFRNVFALLALILLKLLELIVFSKSNDEKRYLIERYEEKCFSNKEQAVDYAHKANFLASQVVTENSIKQIFYIAVSFAFALGMMFFTGNSGCNYVIFHFGLYYVGFNSYSQLIGGLSNRKEMYKMECRFFNRCNL
ncbi:MAG: hypothetical protein KBS97_01830 [Firmicutes bacterium]|nr:hypothetical protein [Candidatus Fiminaster equi]